VCLYFENSAEKEGGGGGRGGGGGWGWERNFSIKAWNFFPCLQRSKTKKGKLNIQ